MSSKPDWLGPTRKGEPIGDLPNLTEEENAKLKTSVVRGSQVGGPKIPDVPDIASTETQSEAIVTDAEFFQGNHYKPQGRKSRTGVTFEIVEHTKEPQHLAFEASVRRMCDKRGIAYPEPTFYVQSNRGTIGWVPWVGSSVVWPWEMGWASDLVEKSPPDPKPSERKR